MRAASPSHSLQDRVLPHRVAGGIKMDMALTDRTQQLGLKIAFLTDPVGTRIELTEGLAAK